MRVSYKGTIVTPQGSPTELVSKYTLGLGFLLDQELPFKSTKSQIQTPKLREKLGFYYARKTLVSTTFLPIIDKGDVPRFTLLFDYFYVLRKCSGFIGIKVGISKVSTFPS